MMYIDDDDDDGIDEHLFGRGSEEESGDEDDISEGDDNSSESTDANEEIKFLRTFQKGDYNAEFDTLLTLDRSAALPARTTQAAYNKPDNWRERNRIGLEKIKIQLQNCITSAMNNQSLSLDVTYNCQWGPQILLDGEEPIVWHESTLDEYWDQIEAVGRRNFTTIIQYIHIENVEMKKERLAAFCSVDMPHIHLPLSFSTTPTYVEKVSYLFRN
jgi:hypothetical protein